MDLSSIGIGIGRISFFSLNNKPLFTKNEDNTLVFKNLLPNKWFNGCSSLSFVILFFPSQDFLSSSLFPFLILILNFNYSYISSSRNTTRFIKINPRGFFPPLSSSLGIPFNNPNGTKTAVRDFYLGRWKVKNETLKEDYITKRHHCRIVFRFSLLSVHPTLKPKKRKREKQEVITSRLILHPEAGKHWKF